LRIKAPRQPFMVLFSVTRMIGVEKKEGKHKNASNAFKFILWKQVETIYGLQFGKSNSNG
jgi:hypothetical protein